VRLAFNWWMAPRIGLRLSFMGNSTGDLLPDDEALPDDDAAAPEVETEEVINSDSEESSEPERDDEPGSEERVKGERISSPRKVARMSTMLKQILEETHNAELDNATKQHLAAKYNAAIVKLAGSLSPDLHDELTEWATELPENADYSDSQLKIAYASLVGWLTGLMDGIKTALVTTDKDKKDKSKLDPIDRPGQYL